MPLYIQTYLCFRDKMGSNPLYVPGNFTLS
jgi:hypothetical protein